MQMRSGNQLASLGAMQHKEQQRHYRNSREPDESIDVTIIITKKVIKVTQGKRVNYCAAIAAVSLLHFK